jgi:hypothetical protein
MTPTRGFLAGTTMLHNVTYEALYVNSGSSRDPGAKLTWWNRGRSTVVKDATAILSAEEIVDAISKSTS